MQAKASANTRSIASARTPPGGRKDVFLLYSGIGIDEVQFNIAAPFVGYARVRRWKYGKAPMFHTQRWKVCVFVRHSILQIRLHVYEFIGEFASDGNRVPDHLF